MTAGRRILYLVNALETDAPTRLTAAMAVAAKQKAYDVQFVAWSRSGPTEEELRKQGIATCVLGKSMMANALALYNLLERLQPHIVHTALARPTLGYALSQCFPRRSPQPAWVAADHGVHEWYEKGWVTGFAMGALMPAIFSRADVVTSVSADAAMQLRSRGVLQDRLRIIPNGVDVRRFYPALRRNRDHLLNALFPGQQHANFTCLIGTAGNLRRIKGHDILLRAIPAVLDHDPAARFVIWGDGPERAELSSLAESLQIQHALSFPGHDSQLDAHLPLLDFYVQPSRIESFGLGAAEAMACGLPVIVSRAGGLPELVTHGTTGLTFESENSTDLATQIIQLIRHPEQRHAIGDAARLHILQHFSQQGMTSAVLALYEQLLQQREAPDERH